MTTFDKTIREISLDGLPVVGKGRTSEIFLLPDGKVAKMLYSKMPEYMAETEGVCAWTASQAGINVVKPYGLVKSGERYGIVFDYVDSGTMAEAIVQKRIGLEEGLEGYMKLLHMMEVSDVKNAGFVNKKDKTDAIIDKLEGLLTEDELERLKKAFAQVPEGTAFIHGDCHMNNVMIQNNTAAFIDMGGASIGHPVWNIISLADVYAVLPQILPDDALVAATGFDKTNCRKIWDYIIQNYFNDRVDRKLMEKVLLSFGTLNLTAAIKFGVFPKELLPILKNIMFSCTDSDYAILGTL